MIDTSYAIFEERYQLSPAQLLSQVGGYLGLYTGIGILGIWQFISFIQALVDRSRSADPTGMSVRDFLRVSLSGREMANEIGNQKARTEERFRKIGSKIESVEVSVNQVKEAMSNQKEMMERMTTDMATHTELMQRMHDVIMELRNGSSSKKENAGVEVGAEILSPVSKTLRL